MRKQIQNIKKLASTLASNKPSLFKCYIQNCKGLFFSLYCPRCGLNKQVFRLRQIMCGLSAVLVSITFFLAMLANSLNCVLYNLKVVYSNLSYYLHRKGDKTESQVSSNKGAPGPSVPNEKIIVLLLIINDYNRSH